MLAKIIYTNINDIEVLPTNHTVGKKQIFVTGKNCDSNLTQAASGSLSAGETVDEHVHPTMEEFYYFESGRSVFTIGSKKHTCKKGVFIMVPAGLKHFIEAVTETHFIYWGISI